MAAGQAVTDTETHYSSMVVLMTAGPPRLVLPAVHGWAPPPTVTVPIYGLTSWRGPKWLMIYQGSDDQRGLRLVHLAYGDELTRKVVAGVVTFAKQLAEDLGDGCWVAATDLSYVGDSVVLQLLESLPHRTRTKNARRAWEAERFQKMSAREIGPPAWSPTVIEVDHFQLEGHRTDIENGFVVCLDAGDVFVGLYFVGSPTAQLNLQPLVDLTGYPLASDADHPQR
jgi:hypothetical protein